jgi:SpoVK/Ycf46/Vps4 family AAA+-type ATPase
MQVEKQLIPDCINPTIAPNDWMKQQWDQMVGVDFLKQQLLTHVEVCTSPSSPFSWHQRHYPNNNFRGLNFRGRILFVGAPGVGKTMLAIACTDRYARLNNKQIYFLELGLVRGKYVGESSRNIARGFEYARNLAERNIVILFIDEFETVGVSRNFDQMHDDVRAMSNQLIKEMNATNSSNIFIIAATNLERHVDYAVKRRFDFVLYFYRPSMQHRTELLAHLLEPYSTSAKDIIALAQKTPRYTQDDLTRLVNRAVERAFSQDKPLTMQHLESALREIKPTAEYR